MITLKRKVIHIQNLSLPNYLATLYDEPSSSGYLHLLRVHSGNTM